MIKLNIRSGTQPIQPVAAHKRAKVVPPLPKVVVPVSAEPWNESRLTTIDFWSMHDANNARRQKSDERLSFLQDGMQLTRAELRDVIQVEEKFHQLSLNVVAEVKISDPAFRKHLMSIYWWEQTEIEQAIGETRAELYQQFLISRGLDLPSIFLGEIGRFQTCTISR